MSWYSTRILISVIVLHTRINNMQLIAFTVLFETWNNCHFHVWSSVKILPIKKHLTLNFNHNCMFAYIFEYIMCVWVTLGNTHNALVTQLFFTIYFRLAYARISRGQLSDTEIQMAKFQIPRNLQHYKDRFRITVLHEDVEEYQRFSKK